MHMYMHIYMKMFMFMCMHMCRYIKIKWDFICRFTKLQTSEYHYVLWLKSVI